MKKMIRKSIRMSGLEGERQTKETTRKEKKKKKEAAEADRKRRRREERTRRRREAAEVRAAGGFFLCKISVSIRVACSLAMRRTQGETAACPKTKKAELKVFIEG